jgi:hypothetical protein
MATIVVKERSEQVRHGRKMIEYTQPEKSGISRPSWDTTRKTLQAAVAEQVRKQEKEKKLQRKYGNQNPIVDRKPSKNYFNNAVSDLSVKPTEG